jgi:histidine ammonia-lyase
MQTNTHQQSSVTRFALGQTYITPGAEEALMIAGQTEIEFLRRHMSNDWGELSDDDARENELSLKEGFRLLSAYQTAKGQKLWIITEADRSATTILLPSEY